MSWSFTAIGKPAAVTKSVEAQVFAMSKCAEPEETIRQQVKTLVVSAVTTLPEDMAVKVTAMGSQTNPYVPSVGYDATKAINSLEVKIEPIFNFVE